MTDQLTQQDVNNTAWAACDTFRGVIDPAQYKDYILVMLFLKYISDQWDSRAARPRAIDTSMPCWSSTLASAWAPSCLGLAGSRGASYTSRPALNHISAAINATNTATTLASLRGVIGGPPSRVRRLRKWEWRC